ncbi:MAG: RsmG family class I SAM-dependent methyltransferase [Acidimicrobiia bacterium]
MGSEEDLSSHIHHSRAFAVVGTPTPGSRLVDLGSGNGLPGLVLAMDWPDTQWWLIETSPRRCDFLRWAAASLGAADRIEVVEGPAEVIGQDPDYRSAAQLVVARAFGPPATTAECGSAFLAVEGRLIVSEPPEVLQDRWPAAPLEQLGLVVGPSYTSPIGLQTLLKTSPLSDRFPRRTGVPRKRPLF